MPPRTSKSATVPPPAAPSGKKASKKAASKASNATPAAPKKAAKKAAAKKTAAKKAAAKKAPAKKAAAKKAAAKKAPAKKAAAKKAPAKKAAAKKAAKAAPAKKATSKKATSKKATSKKAAKKTSRAPRSPEIASTQQSGGGDNEEEEEIGPSLQPGDKAPDFSLPADDGLTYSLRDLAGRQVILYFYPRDNTPGCTVEACDFRDRHADFSAKGTVILGVSGDSITSHARFRAKHGLNFPLLSDPDFRVATAFGAYGEKLMYGRKVKGVIRSTFVIGPDGTLRAVHRPVKVPGHAEALLHALRAHAA